VLKADGYPHRSWSTDKIITNNSSAIAKMAEQCCTSQRLKRWGGSVFRTSSR